MSNMVMTFVDGDMERCSFGVPIPVLDAASITDVTNDVEALRDAVNALSLANETTYTIVASKESTPPVRPTDAYANREAAVVFTCISNTTGSRVSFSLPAPNLAMFPFANLGKGKVYVYTDVVSLPTNYPQLYNMIVAIEAVVVYQQDDGGIETVTVSTIEHVGRNL